MKNLIIIGLLALCAEYYALDAYYDHKEQGYSHKQIAQVTALIERSKGDDHNRKAGRLPDASQGVSSTSPTKYQQIASLWHIAPGEIDKPIRLWGKP